MNEPVPGPFTILGATIGEIIAPGPPKPQKPPKPPMAPHEMHTMWTCLSAGVLVGCTYVTFFAAALTGKSAAALIAEFMQAPADPPAALVIWFAAVLIA